MAFQIRNAKSEPLHAHVDARDRQGLPAKGWSGLKWQKRGSWRSKSLIEYPIPMGLVVGNQSFQLVPLMLAQEVDARSSTGGGQSDARGTLARPWIFRADRLRCAFAHLRSSGRFFKGWLSNK
jgi:hypothetical protein